MCLVCCCCCCFRRRGGGQPIGNADAMETPRRASNVSLASASLSAVGTPSRTGDGGARTTEAPSPVEHTSTPSGRPLPHTSQRTHAPTHPIFNVSPLRSPPRLNNSATLRSMSLLDSYSEVHSTQTRLDQSHILSFHQDDASHAHRTTFDDTSPLQAAPGVRRTGASTSFHPLAFSTAAVRLV